MASQPLVHNAISTTGTAEAGAWVFAYVKDTTTPQAAYTNTTLTTPAANPYEADAAGHVTLYLNDTLNYTILVKSADLANTLLEVDWTASSSSFSITYADLGNFNAFNQALADLFGASGIDATWVAPLAAAYIEPQPAAAILDDLVADSGIDGFVVFRNGSSLTRELYGSGGIGVLYGDGHDADPVISITDAQLVALLGLSPSDGDLIEWDSVSACSVVNKNALAITSTSGTEKTLANWMDSFPLRITSNTTINVPADYATIQLAHDSLAGKRIDDNVTVTINATAAAIAAAATIYWDHPDSKRMRLRGASAATVSITVSTVMTLFYVGADCVLDINGFTITHDTPASRDLSMAFCADQGGVVNVGADMAFSGFYWHIQSRYGGSSARIADGATFTLAGDCDILAIAGGEADIGNITCSAASDTPLGSSIVCEGGSVYIDDGSYTGNLRAGFHMIDGYARIMGGADFSSNTGPGILQDGGFIDMSEACTAGANGTYGYQRNAGVSNIATNGNLTAGGAGANTTALFRDLVEDWFSSQPGSIVRSPDANASRRYDTKGTGTHFFNVNGTGQVAINDGSVYPITTNDIDFGDATHFYKDGYLTRLLVKNGTAAAPSIAFGDDTDNGFYRATTDTTGITRAGAFIGAFGATLRYDGGFDVAATTVIDSNRLFRHRVYTVATLPAGAAGYGAFASDLRVFNGAGTQEGAAAGTGGSVEHNGTAWKIAGTNITAVA